MTPASGPAIGVGTRLPIGLDFDLQAGRWPAAEGLHALVATALGAAIDELDLDNAEASEVSVVFTDDSHMRALNREWRERDSATNVLSFPAWDLAPGYPLPPLLGDIVLACETTMREAALENKPFEHHLTHLVIHGFLHLLGYDHATEDDARVMESLEGRILARLSIPDPHADAGH